jgi:LmbE family N-acetylglucosaminyl deacetylase
MAGLMAFHAHPDDESSSMGGVLAKYAAAGEEVVVVTATDGAEGEIQNYPNPEELWPKLAEMRHQEVLDALAILGVRHHEFLGYRDSGMMGTAPNANPDSFWQADFSEATTRLIRLIRKYQPEVLTIYDPWGGYGHPDHIQVHRIGLAAFFGSFDVSRYPVDAGQESWAPKKLYWSTPSRSRMQKFAKHRFEGGKITEDEYARYRQSGVPNDEITAVVDISGYLDEKLAALKAHRTQIPDDWYMFQVPEEHRPAVFGTETFQRIYTRVEAPFRETDLFEGLR